MTCRYLKYGVLAAITAALSCNECGWAQQTEPAATLTLEFPIDSPPSLGDGWGITENRRKLQSCVSFTKKTLNYQDKRARVMVSEDYESLARALEVSISAKYNGAVSNFSANAGFVNNSKFSAHSLNVAVFAEVTQGPEYAAPLEVDAKAGGVIAASKKVTLLPDFAKMAETDIVGFRRQCGDGFISTIKSGARINGVLTFRDVTREESQTITAAVGGGGSAGSFSAAFKSVMQKYDDAKRFNVDYLGLGGADDTIPLTKEALLLAVEKLPEKTKVAPRPFEMVMMRYDELPNWPPITVPRTLSDMEILARAYWQMRTLYLYTQEALTEDPWLLTLDAKRPALIDFQVELSRQLEELKTKINGCLVQEKSCSAGTWRMWNDLDVRARLPMRGSWADIKYVPNVERINDIVQKLANARVDYWITPIVKLRCDRDHECIPFKTVEQIKENMIRRMQASLEH